MNANFLTLLFGATLFSGIIYAIDKFLWQPKRRAAGINTQPKIIEYCRSFFPILLLVLVIRSFIFQLFVVPSGSLEPTIMPKAFIVVNQFAYGLRLPVSETKVIPIGEPKRGDIVLFHSPVQPNKDLIKRLIGLPGDKISYINRVLYINGEKMPQTFISYTTDSDNTEGPTWTVKVMEEDFMGIKHKIYVCAEPTSNSCPGAKNVDFYNLVVPAGHYFMMGDNRDNSDDSRFWGFVPETNIMGRGWLVLFSWNSSTSSIRWDQVGSKL
jgi:signal peptidase I